MRLNCVDVLKELLARKVEGWDWARDIVPFADVLFGNGAMVLVRTVQLLIRIDKFLAIWFLEVARNLSILIMSFEIAL